MTPHLTHQQLCDLVDPPRPRIPASARSRDVSSAAQGRPSPRLLRLLRRARHPHRLALRLPRHRPRRRPPRLHRVPARSRSTADAAFAIPSRLLGHRRDRARHRHPALSPRPGTLLSSSPSHPQPSRRPRQLRVRRRPPRGHQPGSLHLHPPIHAAISGPHRELQFKHRQHHPKDQLT